MMVLLIAGSLAVIFKVKSSNSSNIVSDQGQVQQEEITVQTNAAPGDYPKTDNSGNHESTTASQTGEAVPSQPTDTSSLATLDSTLTAQESGTDASILIAFYVQGPGYFTVQKKVSGFWKTTNENVYYSGSGGLEADALRANEDSNTYRVLKIENGQYIALSKEYTVFRTDVINAGGIKTYHS